MLSPQAVALLALIFTAFRGNDPDPDLLSFFARLLYSVPSLEHAFPDASSFYNALPPSISPSDVEEPLSCIADPATDDLKLLFSTLPHLITDFSRSHPSPSPLFDSNSPLGLFLRSSFVKYESLSVPNVISLVNSLSHWLDPDKQHPISSSDSPKPSSSSKNDHQEALSNYHSSLTSANVLHMKDLVRRYSEISGLSMVSVPSKLRSRHQHALLSLAKIHFDHGEWSSARYALKEAFSTAQAVSDHACLNEAFNLERKLDYYAPLPRPTKTIQDQDVLPPARSQAFDFKVDATRKSTTSTSPPSSLSPFPMSRTNDVLFNIRIMISMGEPIRNIFPLISRALHIDCTALKQQQQKHEELSSSSTPSTESTSNIDSRTVESEFQACHREAVCHSVGAELWSIVQGGAGRYFTPVYNRDTLHSSSLADVHRFLALQQFHSAASYYDESEHTFTPMIAVDRMALISSQTSRLSYNGSYDESLLLLLKETPPRRKSRMTHIEAQIWQGAVWDTWKLRARRENHPKILQRLEKYDMPSPSPYYNASPIEDGEKKIRNLLDKAESLIESSQPALALPPLLEALERISKNGYFELEILAKTMLAGIYADFCEGQLGLDELDAVLPNIAQSSRYVQGFANLQRARCQTSIALQLEEPESQAQAQLFEKALANLQSAANDFIEVHDYKMAEKALSHLAVLYDACGRSANRDEKVKQWTQMLEYKRNLEGIRMEELDDWYGWVVEVSSLAAAGITGSPSNNDSDDGNEE